MTNEYQWSGFDPNRWDHYYAAGQQIRFYRECPGGFHVERGSRWNRMAESVLAWFQRISGVLAIKGATDG